MSDWDNEDFEFEAKTTNEFGEEEESLLSDWEAGALSDEEKKSVAPKPKLSAVDRINQRKQKEQQEREKKALEKTAAASKDEQHAKELESDLNNAADLLAAADIHPRSRQNLGGASSVSAGPAKLSDLAIFDVNGLKDYADLRKTLVPVITKLADKNTVNHHTNFIIETCRDVCKPLNSEQVNKVISTLTAIANQKSREERAARLGSRQKPQIKQASAKQASAKPAQQVDTLEDDGLDDDDFM